MSAPGKIALLTTLYLVQGLPFGVQAKALPIYLRARGVSLETIGFLGLLAAPWLFKILWAPLVERYWSARLGKRRTWILPMQLGLAACAGAAMFTDPASDLSALLALIFAMNLFAATMDIAVDGLAVDLLGPAELGIGNTAQVVGYKLGMLTSGGLLVWASASIGWMGVFAGVAVLSMVGFAVAALTPVDVASGGDQEEPPTLRQIFSVLAETARRPGAAVVLGCVVTYKLGETMADAMFKPFLVDAGFSASQIGLWVGTIGMVASLLGSVAGGTLATRIGVRRALWICALLRVIPMVGQWWLATVTPTAGAAIAITCGEHLFGGALTTAMFAFMMSQVDRRIGATHYTALATLEVLGKMPSAWASGFIAGRAGYATLFAVATVLSVAFIGLVAMVRKKELPPDPRAVF